MVNQPSSSKNTNTKRDTAYYNRQKAIERLDDSSKKKQPNRNVVELFNVLKNIDENAPLAKMNECSMQNYGTKTEETRTYFSFDAPPLLKKREAMKATPISEKAFKKSGKNGIIKKRKD